MDEVNKLDVVTNIKQKYDVMTKTQKKIADFMLDNPDSMSFITLKEISQSVNVSELTILNFCTMLGYENFNELKYEFRKYITMLCKITVQAENLYASPSVPARELSDKQNLLLQVCQEEFDMGKAFFASLDLDKIFEAAKKIIKARYVIICGFGVSRQIADFFSARLALLGIGSVVVNTELQDNIQAALPLLSPDALVIAISFPDYYLLTTKVAEYAHSKNVPIMAITDSLKTPVVKYSSLTLTCQTTTRLFLNTITLPVMLVNFISSAINIEKSASNTKMPSAPEEFASFFQTY